MYFRRRKCPSIYNDRRGRPCTMFKKTWKPWKLESHYSYPQDFQRKHRTTDLFWGTRQMTFRGAKKVLPLIPENSKTSCLWKCSDQKLREKSKKNIQKYVAFTILAKLYIIFHQPRFPWKEPGSHFPSKRLPFFGGPKRSWDVAFLSRKNLTQKVGGAWQRAWIVRLSKISMPWKSTTILKMVVLLEDDKPLLK